MKYTLEVPDQDADFVLEFLRRVTSVKLTPARSKKVAPDTTKYLMSGRTNRERLLAAMDEIERGEATVRKWPQP